ncbi:MAG: uroporphyrinogen decarboxylase family protein [Verrucomicrobiota bacterium]|nr:uroporphyrinogen decarboxylase family protein [Verrucomicrobiota bacterium]
MKNKPFIQMLKKAYHEKRRLVAPLLGFPGLNMIRCNIKVTQQNYGRHFQVIKAISDTFQPDIVFPLMDLSVEANALGNYTIFPKDDSATVIKEETSLDESLKFPDVNISYDTRLLGYVETIKLMDIGLSSSILKGAYVTGPYSLAALIIGAEEAAMSTVMEPKKLELLCQFATDKIQKYVNLLIAAGAQVICILEPSAVMLGPEQFEQFSSNFVSHISKSCQFTNAATIYHTCGNIMHLIDQMVSSGVDGISLDSQSAGVDLPAVAEQIPEETAIIGNISPTETMLTGTEKKVKNEVIELLEQMEMFPNFVLSTGCDLPQEVPIDNLHAFMESGRKYKLKK